MSCRVVIEVSAEVASHLSGKPLIKSGTAKSEEAYERILESIQSCFLFDGDSFNVVHEHQFRAGF